MWMIDFTKAFLLQPPLKKVSHRDKWKLGNHEDGYLTGIDNLIKVRCARGVFGDLERVGMDVNSLLHKP